MSASMTIAPNMPQTKLHHRNETKYSESLEPGFATGTNAAERQRREKHMIKSGNLLAKKSI